MGDSPERLPEVVHRRGYKSHVRVIAEARVGLLCGRERCASGGGSLCILALVV